MKLIGSFSFIQHPELDVGIDYNQFADVNFSLDLNAKNINTKALNQIMKPVNFGLEGYFERSLLRWL